MQSSHNILILEDSPDRIKVFNQKLIGNRLFITDQADDAINLIKKSCDEHDEFDKHDRPLRIDAIYLDHDLDGMTFVDSNKYLNTGMRVVRWLVDCQEWCQKLKKIPIIIHSHNFVAADDMRMALLSVGYFAFCTPFWQIAGHSYKREFKSSPIDTVNFNNKTLEEIRTILNGLSLNRSDYNGIEHRVTQLVENYNSYLEETKS